MVDFIHLNTHSYYSLLEAVPSPLELVKTAERFGMPALGLTDRFWLSGAVEFTQACKNVGIQPILGIEIPIQMVVDQGKDFVGDVALIAEDEKGWGNLCRLSSTILANPSASDEMVIEWEQLNQFAQGVICIAGCHPRRLSQRVGRDKETQTRTFMKGLNEIFPHSLYVGLIKAAPGRNANPEQIADLAKRLRIPVVSIHPIYYLQQEEFTRYRLLSAIRMNTPIAQLPDYLKQSIQAAFVDPEDMQERFSEFPDAIQATVEIAQRCHFNLPIGEQHFPHIDLPEGVTPDEALRQRAYQGARMQYEEITDEIKERLDHELSVITGLGYSSIFLIMSEIINFAHQEDILVASRGSAASSLVAHCLGITTPDPLGLDLYFERFLNPARKSPPDIDTDICSRDRDRLIQFVYDRFGDHRVAMVSTVNRFRSRSALREVAKAHGISQQKIKRLIDSLPRRGWGPPRDRGDSTVSPYQMLLKKYPSHEYKQVFRDAEAIIDIPDHLSIHPGGVVIAPGEITDLVPTMMTGKGVAITQFDLESIKDLGLVKIDLLGIRGLSVLGEVAEIMLNQSSDREKSRRRILESIPDEDELAGEFTRNGRTIGCFQIESPGMRRTLQEVSARNVADVLVALALYRPGPLTGGLKDAFIQRHLGIKPVEHIHSSLAPILAETHGVILYQEQVLRIANELAGFNMSEADLLRRAMSHFDPGKRMQTLKEKFVRNAHSRHAIPEEICFQIWDMMAAFAGYGFPKAHAASYAEISWRSAWCKAHFPAAFMAAVLANWGGYYSQEVYILEARRLNLSVKQPHVHFSKKEFSVDWSEERNTLYMGLDQIRDLTRRTMNRILTQKPFRNLDDFLTRVDPRLDEVKNLVRVGALKGFGSIPGLLAALEGATWQRKQMALFPLEAGEESEWTQDEQVSAQRDILGIAVNPHPLDLVTDRVGGEILSINAAQRLAGKDVKINGMRQVLRKTTRSDGRVQYFMDLGDLSGCITVIMDENVYDRGKGELTGRGPFIVQGNVEKDERTGIARIQAKSIDRM